MSIYGRYVFFNISSWNGFKIVDKPIGFCFANGVINFLERNVSSDQKVIILSKSLSLN